MMHPIRHPGTRSVRTNFQHNVLRSIQFCTSTTCILHLTGYRYCISNTSCDSLSDKMKRTLPSKEQQRSVEVKDPTCAKPFESELEENKPRRIYLKPSFSGLPSSFYFSRDYERTPPKVKVIEYLESQNTASDRTSAHQLPLAPLFYKVHKQCEYYAVRLPLLKAGLRRVPQQHFVPCAMSWNRPTFSLKVLQSRIKRYRSLRDKLRSQLQKKLLQICALHTLECEHQVIQTIQHSPTLKSLDCWLISKFSRLLSRASQLISFLGGSVPKHSPLSSSLSGAILPPTTIQSEEYNASPTASTEMEYTCNEIERVLKQQTECELQLLGRPTNPHHRLNHFPGSATELGCKSGLQRNLSKMQQKYAKKTSFEGKSLFSFSPFTWCLPRDALFLQNELKMENDSMRAASAKRNLSSGNSHSSPYAHVEMSSIESARSDTSFSQSKASSFSERVPRKYIIKPSRGSCGRGISVVTANSPKLTALLQRYLPSGTCDAKKTDSIEFSDLPNNPDDYSSGSSSSEPTPPYIVQQYIDEPMLLEGFKFDVRLYVLVTSLDPLVIYRYEEGLARFAAEPYDPQALSNRFSQLTNYSVGRKYTEHVSSLLNEAFPTSPTDLPQTWKPNLKSTLADLNKRLRSQGVNITQLWRDVDDVILQTLMATCEPLLGHLRDEDVPLEYSLPCRSSFFSPTEVSTDKVLEITRRSKKTRCVRHGLSNMALRNDDSSLAEDCLTRSQILSLGCFELYGFDIMFDHLGKPLLLEVNVLPSLESSSSLDYELKSNVVTDMFNLLCITSQELLTTRSDLSFSYKPCLNHQKKKNGSRKGQHVLPTKSINSFSSRVAARKKRLSRSLVTKSNLTSFIMSRIRDEVAYKGRFKRIFPTPRRVSEFGKYILPLTEFNASLWCEINQQQRQRRTDKLLPKQ